MKCFGLAISWACTCFAIPALFLACGGKEPSAPPPLSEIERDRNTLTDTKQPPEARAAAAKRLRQVGIATGDGTILADLLKSIKREPAPETRIETINASIGIVLHTKQELPVELVELLFDPDEEVRHLAAGYVSAAGGGPRLFGSPPVEAIPLLLKALHHDDAHVRSSAVDALSHIHVDQKIVLPELKTAMRDKSYMVRNNATVAMWRMTKQADLVIPAFAALAGSTEPLENDTEECIRKVILIGLASTIESIVKEKPNEVSAELLLGFHSRSKNVRNGSAFLLTHFLKGNDEALKRKRESVREELRRLAADSDLNVRVLVKPVFESADELQQMPSTGAIALNSERIPAAQAAARPGMPAKSLAATMREPAPAREQGPIIAVAPAPAETLHDALTAIVRWDRGKEGAVHAPVELTVSTRPNFGAPIVRARLDRSAIDYRLTVLPSTHYYWKVVPVRDGKQQPKSAAASDFISGAPRNEDKAGDALRYRNPRVGAHWGLETVVPFRQAEPLSPWFDRKSYNTAPPPKFADVKGNFPVPVWDGHQDAIDAYWYCWKTLLDVWTFAPSARDHQAVSNMIGLRSWGRWGSTMVLDTAFILHFARYGNQAYPFISGLDNCYARQHENGFICRETDRENRETYVIFPLNPPLFAWAEWEYYKISGDKDRLARVLPPIVKHYEWWMTYQRRANGVYWTNGFNEADDSPRNQLAYSCVSATAYQALAALCLARIADTVGRKDLARFFRQEHASLGRLINDVFWDQKHGIYNDLARDGKFITELEPGVFCKHAHMFWPLVAEVAPADRVKLVAGEIMNPKTFYRRNGIASLSADSKGFNAPTGQYWRGAVWPPIQCMVQEGLKANGRMDQAGELALRYERSVIDVFKKEQDITENLAPDEPRGCGVGQFVGWGGIGPISNLIEYALGFDIDCPKKTITWRIHNQERHGLTHFKLGDFHIDLICDQRHSDKAPCRVHVTSGGHFTLTLVAHGKTVEKQIAPGEHELSMD